MDLSIRRSSVEPALEAGVRRCCRESRLGWPCNDNDYWLNILNGICSALEPNSFNHTSNVGLACIGCPICLSMISLGRRVFRVFSLSLSNHKHSLLFIHFSCHSHSCKPHFLGFIKSNRGNVENEHMHIDDRGIKSKSQK